MFIVVYCITYVIVEFITITTVSLHPRPQTFITTIITSVHKCDWVAVCCYLLMNYCHLDQPTAYLGTYIISFTCYHFDTSSCFFKIQLFYISWTTGQGLYQLLTMVDTGGTRTCVRHTTM